VKKAKRYGFGLVVIVACVLCMGQSCEVSGTERNAQRARETANKSANAVEVPELRYFQERKTIAKWAETFDTPDITCYLYLISYGQILGYYVTNGKPAATTSYLTPEYRISSEGRQTQLPDTDGTYGTNNPGIRFFTASGIAVEWAGDGATYLFSTQKLPVQAVELGN